jgi:GNAT superfamily N-acetyltransferase
MLNETIFMEATILVKVRMLADIVGHDQRGGPVDRLLTCFTRARQRSEHLTGNECPGLEVFAMSESTAVTAEVRLLDGGYSHETRSLLYHAYRREPTFAYLFEAARPGYDHRIRATVRELVQQHFYQELPALGLLIGERLIGVALIAPPQRRLSVTESWAWRMRMLLSTGFNCTRRYLDYQAALMACLPTDAVHMLPLLGVHPQFQGQHFGEQLLQALHDWCAEDEHSQGIVLDTGNEHYLAFYARQGYQEIGEIAVGPVREHVFFHPNPQHSRQIGA